MYLGMFSPFKNPNYDHKLDRPFLNQARPNNRETGPNFMRNAWKRENKMRSENPRTTYDSMHNRAFRLENLTKEFYLVANLKNNAGERTAVKTLLDTGADFTAASLSCAEKLFGDVDYSVNKTACAANSSSMTVYYIVRDVEFEIGGFKINLDVYVANITDDLIVGADFSTKILRQNGNWGISNSYHSSSCRKYGSLSGKDSCCKISCTQQKKLVINVGSEVFCAPFNPELDRTEWVGNMYNISDSSKPIPLTAAEDVSLDPQSTSFLSIRYPKNASLCDGNLVLDSCCTKNYLVEFVDAFKVSFAFALDFLVKFCPFCRDQNIHEGFSEVEMRRIIVVPVNNNSLSSIFIKKGNLVANLHLAESRNKILVTRDLKNLYNFYENIFPLHSSDNLGIYFPQVSSGLEYEMSRDWLNPGERHGGINTLKNKSDVSQNLDSLKHTDLKSFKFQVDGQSIVLKHNFNNTKLGKLFEEFVKKIPYLFLTGDYVPLRAWRCDPVDLGVYKDATLRKHKPPMLSPDHQQALEELIEKLVAQGVITEIPDSEFSSKVLIVPKKIDEKTGKMRYRFVQVLCELSLKSRPLDFYIEPPRLQIERLEPGSKFFSKIDLASAFFGIELNERSKTLTGFCIKGDCNNQRHFRSERLVMGHRNSMQLYQRTFRECMGEDFMRANDMFFYADDSIVSAPTEEFMLTRLINVLGKM